MTRNAHNRIVSLCLTAGISLVALTGCRLLREQGTDDLIDASGNVYLVLDRSRLSPTAFAEKGVLTAEARARVNDRLVFLERFTADANNWFLPVAATYLPNLEEGPLKRLVPVAGSSTGPLLASQGENTLAVNLNADAWSAPTAVTTALRLGLIQPAAAAAARTLTAERSNNPRRAQVLHDIFVFGVSAYLSSFGMTVETSPMTPAMSGDRRYMETLFAVVRGEVAADRSGTDINHALTNVGLWMCYEIESVSGREVLAESVSDGPEALYQQYLTTHQGILLTLEPLPVQTRPVPDSLMTH